MTISMYQICVPVLLEKLAALSAVLAKGEANATERKIDPQVFLSARLAPDMFALTRQVQIATDHAKGVPSRLAGRDVPRYEDTETTFADLQGRITRTIDHVRSFSVADIDGSEDRHIEIKAGPRVLTFNGSRYLLSYALPNFYFHAVTAYDILRANGVPVGKPDFLGAVQG